MPGPQSYPCSTCKAEFHTRNGVKSHYRASLTCTDTRCPTCGKIFANPSGLASHCNAKRHGHGIPPNVYCQICKRGFRSLAGLEMHMNVLGHFTLTPIPVVKTSTTMNSAVSELIEPTLNPSAYLDGQGEIPLNDGDQEVSAMDRTAHPAPAPAGLDPGVGNPAAASGGAQWTPLHPIRNLSCAFCDASFGTPSAVAHHIESGCHSITRHQVTAAVYAMNIVPDITIGLIGGASALPTALEAYVATSASFTGMGYQCHLCLQPPFKSLYSLNRHLNSAAHDGRKFKCPKCKRKFKLISAFLQHLEAGRCGLAEMPEITGYFHDLSAQFSGLLTM